MLIQLKLDPITFRQLVELQVTIHTECGDSPSLEDLLSKIVNSVYHYVTEPDPDFPNNRRTSQPHEYRTEPPRKPAKGARNLLEFHGLHPVISTILSPTEN